MYLKYRAFTFITADCESHAKEWLDQVYEKEHRALDEQAGQKDWEYSTNINDQTAEAAVSKQFYI